MEMIESHNMVIYDSLSDKLSSGGIILVFEYTSNLLRFYCSVQLVERLRGATKDLSFFRLAECAHDFVEG